MTNLEELIINKVHSFPPEKQQKLLDYAESLDETVETATSPKRLTIWAKVKDLIEEVPEEDWKELPSDGSLNVDHYLYDSPKRSK